MEGGSWVLGGLGETPFSRPAKDKFFDCDDNCPGVRSSLGKTQVRARRCQQLHPRQAKPSSCSHAGLSPIWFSTAAELPFL